MLKFGYLATILTIHVLTISAVWRLARVCRSVLIFAANPSLSQRSQFRVIEAVVYIFSSGLHT